jgi:hypothetical protein
MITELTRSGSEFGDIRVLKVKLCQALAQVSISKLCNFVPANLQEDLKYALQFCKMNVGPPPPPVVKEEASSVKVVEPTTADEPVSQNRGIVYQDDNTGKKDDQLCGGNCVVM